MSLRIDRLVSYCIALEDEYPHARRGLSALRRSRRDVQFNGYIGAKRIRLIVAKPIVALLDRLCGAPDA